MCHPSSAPTRELSVDTNVGETDLFGKQLSDLQTGVTVGTDGITGTLKYVTDYTGYSSDPELQVGNYLVIHCVVNDSEPISVELIGGHSGPKTLDSDGVVVLRIENKDTQSVRVVSGDITKTYSLTELVLESE